jgi:large subunit ribosomal protein L18
MRIQKRRRRENKTDYGRRLKLLKSKKPRVVFRKTNKYVTSQYVLGEEAKDKVILGINSKKLLTLGWPKELEGSLKSIPASYLTGYLMGKTIQKEKLEAPIVDLGMQRTIYKTKVYAFIKGLIDSGIEIACKKEAFPEEERLMGKNLIEDSTKFVEEVKSKIEQN